MMNVVAPPISMTGTYTKHMHLQILNCDLYSFVQLLQVEMSNRKQGFQGKFDNIIKPLNWASHK